MHISTALDLLFLPFSIQFIKQNGEIVEIIKAVLLSSNYDKRIITIKILSSNQIRTIKYVSILKINDIEIHL